MKIDAQAIDKNLDVAAETARQLAKTNLKYLCTKILGFTDWDICHDELAAWLETSSRRFKLILMPRGHLKTSIITIGKSIQHILCNPDVKILYASAVMGNAESFLAQARELLASKSPLNLLFGKFESDVWNSERITVAQRKNADKTPTISPSGVDKSIVSQHYDVIFADDLVNRQTINTSEQILKTKKYYSDLMDLLNPGGTLYVLGTRWDDKDLYGNIILSEKQATAEGRPQSFDIYVRRAVEKGQIIFPKKFTHEILANLLHEKGSYDFSCQYNNDPISREDQQFKPPVRYWHELPPVGRRMLTVDLAPGLVPGMQDNPEGDNNAITSTIFTPANQLYVVKYKYGRFNVTETIDHIFEAVNSDNPWVVGIEANAYQRVFIHLLQLEMKRRNRIFNVVPIIQHRDKFTRLMALQPLWESGDLLLKPGMVELEEEFDRFPRGMHDDILDTLEMALHLVQGTRTQIEAPKPWAALTDQISRQTWEDVDTDRKKRYGRDSESELPVANIGV